MHVPSTLTGVLQSRLDSLPREERLILQRASVVGRRFWGAAVEELAGEDVGSESIESLLDVVARHGQHDRGGDTDDDSVWYAPTRQEDPS